MELNKILETINNEDNEDNIYYHCIEEETCINEVMELLHVNAVESLYIIKVSRENLFDRFFDYLKHENLLTKHKYVFINLNLPKIYKIKIKIKAYRDLLDCKTSCPLLSQNNFTANASKGEFIVALI